MSKHTPGPWTDTDNDGMADGYVWAADQTIVCSTGESSRQLADAALIAAAPDLLAALKRIKIVMDGVIAPAMRRPDDALSEVEAAIAKAEGDQ